MKTEWIKSVSILFDTPSDIEMLQASIISSQHCVHEARLVISLNDCP